jgi:hypothetical protein
MLAGIATKVSCVAAVSLRGASPDRIYGIAASMAAGMVAGSGGATATSPAPQQRQNWRRDKRTSDTKHTKQNSDDDPSRHDRRPTRHHGSYSHRRARRKCSAGDTFPKMRMDVPGVTRRRPCPRHPFCGRRASYRIPSALSGRDIHPCGQSLGGSIVTRMVTNRMRNPSTRPRRGEKRPARPRPRVAGSRPITDAFLSNLAAAPAFGHEVYQPLQRLAGNRAVAILIAQQAGGCDCGCGGSAGKCSGGRTGREEQQTTTQRFGLRSSMRHDEQAWSLAIQRWWIPIYWPPPDPDADLPTLPLGEQWAHIDVARQYLHNYAVHDQTLKDQHNALTIAAVADENLRLQAIKQQEVARGELDRIRRSDIWPNWGTLAHALTVIGTVSTCLEGSCLVGLALGAITLFQPETGVAGHVAESCLPNPAHAECAQAIALGAAHLVADRKDEEATRARLSDKERAHADLANAKLAEQHFSEDIRNLDGQLDVIDDEILFLEKAYKYARYGRPADDSHKQKYKSGIHTGVEI